MHLETLTVGAYFTNCYVVWCSKTKEAIIIDPGFNSQAEAHKVLSVLKEKGLRTKFIVDTHGHPDHACGNGIAKKSTGAQILIHVLDGDILSGAEKRLSAIFGFATEPSVADSLLKDGDVVRFGDVELQVIHTPGHTPGSISLRGKEAVFTGDTLFAGSVGRVDLPGGSGRDLMRSLSEKLTLLPDELVVYPGHGPMSTIGREKRSNPFLRDFDVALLG